MDPIDHISAFSSYPKSGQGLSLDLKISKIIGSILKGEPTTVWWAECVFLVQHKKPLILILDFNKFKSFLSSSVSKFTKIFFNFKFLWITFLLCKYLMASIICFIKYWIISWGNGLLFSSIYLSKQALKDWPLQYSSTK